MSAWHRRYNVSGTVDCGDRLNQWCEVLRDVLKVDDVSYVSHLTGEVTIASVSAIADVVSTGGNVHSVHALAHGGRQRWFQFVETLKSDLAAIRMQNSLMVHDAVETLP